MPTFFVVASSPLRRSITPYGQAGTQYPQPLQMSSCTTTVPNSVRNSDPVGQTSRQAAWVQCLQTSDDISQRTPLSPDSAPWSSPGGRVTPGGPEPGIPRSVVSPCGALTSTGFSMNVTWRHVLAPSSWVLS